VPCVSHLNPPCVGTRTRGTRLCARCLTTRRTPRGLWTSSQRARGTAPSVTATGPRPNAPTTSTCRSRRQASRMAMVTVRPRGATAARHRAGSTSGTTAPPLLCTTRRSSSGLSTTTCSTRLGSPRWSLGSSGTTSGQPPEAASPILWGRCQTTLAWPRTWRAGARLPTLVRIPTRPFGPQSPTAV
jgi:hypothetical protein